MPYEPGSVIGAWFYRVPGAIIYLERTLPHVSSSLPEYAPREPGIGRTTLPWRILFDLAPDGVYLAGHVTAPAGGLLHHPFTLTAANRGGLLSVALACGLPRVDVIHHPVLWSPDFPRSIRVPRDCPDGPFSPHSLYAYLSGRLFTGFVSRVRWNLADALAACQVHWVDANSSSPV